MKEGCCPPGGTGELRVGSRADACTSRGPAHQLEAQAAEEMTDLPEFLDRRSAP